MIPAWAGATANKLAEARARASKELLTGFMEILLNQDIEQVNVLSFVAISVKAACPLMQSIRR
jgi:hypothetical protein